MDENEREMNDVERKAWNDMADAFNEGLEHEREGEGKALSGMTYVVYRLEGET